MDGGIKIYINKKYKNILVRLEVLDGNLPIFDTNRSELYNSQFSRLTSGNFIQAINNPLYDWGFSKPLEYIVIEIDGTINRYSGQGISNIPFLLRCAHPDELSVKENSLIRSAQSIPPNILQPTKRLAYNKIEGLDQINWFSSKSPTYTTISLNRSENIRVRSSFGLRNITNRTIFRFSGEYSPIFHRIPIFDNYGQKFITHVTDFAKTRQTIISKANRLGSLLKLKNNPRYKSIYPILDEFGYTTWNFQLFKSTWDKRFWIETSPNRITNVGKKINIIDPTTTERPTKTTTIICPFDCFTYSIEGLPEVVTTTSTTTIPVTTTSTTTIPVITTSTTTIPVTTTSTTTIPVITTSTTTIPVTTTTSTTTSFVSPGFTSSFVLSTSPRYIPLQSNIGNWDVFSDFSSGVTRNSNNNPLSQPLFTTPLFSFNDPQSSLNISVLDSSGNFYSGLTTSLGSNGTQTGSGFTITKTGRVQQGSLWAIQASGNITLPEALPIGGRFKVRLTLTDNTNVLINTSPDYFWDNDGTQSSINTSQLPELSSLNNQVVVYSGISYFTTGNIFRMSLGGINLLNDQTIPTTRQISMESVLLPISPSTFNGFGDGTKPSIGIAIQGWTLSSSVSGLTFSATSSMAQISGNYHPGFVNTTSNSLSAYDNIHLVSKLFDWGEALSLQSLNYNLLIDTYTYSPTTDPLINNIDGETNRFSFVSRTLSGYGTFTSSIPLSSNSSELQYIFGRIIYPQHNFTGILPSSYNYTSLSGITSTFSVYTNLDAEVTTQVTLSDFRWYVTRYQRPDTNTFTNGRFIFDSNWNEQDLTNEDLAILVRINNDGFLLLSGDIGSYEGRTLLSENNLDNLEKSISFTTGASITPFRVWLLVGYKNTTRGKNLWVSNISLNTEND